MNEMNDLVVAVLLNYNQNEYTLKCIDSLLLSEYENFKIVLIDNGSERSNVAQLELALPKSDRLIFKKIEDNIGYARGTNFGLEEGLKLDPKYFLIMNNDTIIDTQAIAELVKTSKLYNDRARVTGKVYHYNEPEKLQFIAFKNVSPQLLKYKGIGLNEEDKGQYDTLEELDMIDDIFVLQSAELFRSIGGYSKYLWINGVNVDLSLRALSHGYKLVFSPKAKLWHKGSVSFGGRNMNPKMAFWNIQSRLTIRYIHLNKANFMRVYFKITSEIIRTYVKTVYLKIFRRTDNFKYANAKLKALIYFHKWTVNQNENLGYNPY